MGIHLNVDGVHIVFSLKEMSKSIRPAVQCKGLVVIGPRCLVRLLEVSLSEFGRGGNLAEETTPDDRNVYTTVYDAIYRPQPWRMRA